MVIDAAVWTTAVIIFYWFWFCLLCLLTSIVPVAVFMVVWNPHCFCISDAASAPYMTNGHIPLHASTDWLLTFALQPSIRATAGERNHVNKHLCFCVKSRAFHSGTLCKYVCVVYVCTSQVKQQECFSIFCVGVITGLGASSLLSGLPRLCVLVCQLMGASSLGAGQSASLTALTCQPCLCPPWGFHSSRFISVQITGASGSSCPGIRWLISIVCDSVVIGKGQEPQPHPRSMVI